MRKTLVYYTLPDVYTVGAGKWAEAALIKGGHARIWPCHRHNTCRVDLWIPCEIKDLFNYVKNAR